MGGMQRVRYPLGELLSLGRFAQRSPDASALAQAVAARRLDLICPPALPAGAASPLAARVLPLLAAAGLPSEAGGPAAALRLPGAGGDTPLERLEPAALLLPAAAEFAWLAFGRRYLVRRRRFAAALPAFAPSTLERGACQAAPTPLALLAARGSAKRSSPDAASPPAPPAAPPPAALRAVSVLGFQHAAHLHHLGQSLPRLRAPARPQRRRRRARRAAAGAGRCAGGAAAGPAPAGPGPAVRCGVGGCQPRLAAVGPGMGAGGPAGAVQPNPAQPSPAQPTSTQPTTPRCVLPVHGTTWPRIPEPRIVASRLRFVPGDASRHPRSFFSRIACPSSLLSLTASLCGPAPACRTPPPPARHTAPAPAAAPTFTARRLAFPHAASVDAAHALGCLRLCQRLRPPRRARPLRRRAPRSLPRCPARTPAADAASRFGRGRCCR